MKTEILEFKDVKTVKKIVENDGVVAFPTETVYGLGARHDSFLAYNHIFEAKNRPENKVLTLMLTDINDIKNYAEVSEKTQKVIEEFMPGALTIVLPIKKGVEIIGTTSTIGIRVPDSKQTLDFLKAIEIPMFVTSANLSNHPAALSFDEVVEQLDSRIDVIIKGEISQKQASSVVSIIDGKIEVLREGKISLEEIERVYNS